MTRLETRTALPDALRVLVEQYPRDIWTSHRNFDALTRFWMERHLMFRDLLERLTVDAERFLDGAHPPRSYGQQTARLAGFFMNQLHGHHQIEDMHYFPKLSGLDARLTEGFELLDADHHALDGHLQALADDTNAALRALGEGAPAAARDSVGRLHHRLGRFHGFLDRHLLDEEDLVIPTILHHAPEL